MPVKSGRKVIRQACDGCRIRKIKCSELPPCNACVVAGIQCTFQKAPSTRGPRTLRPKTVQQIKEQQKQHGDEEADYPAHHNSSSDARSTSSSQNSGTIQGCLSDTSPSTSAASLVQLLSVYRLRLFPVWPIVAAEDVIKSLEENQSDMLTYALANAVGAATVAQLKLDSLPDIATASSMEAECRRAKAIDDSGRQASLNTLRIAFFLHVYHENQEPGGVQSLLYLREAISLAQIMGLHRESTYAALSSSEQETRRSIVWLLFVTERGVAMLHNLPVVLKCNTPFPSTDGDDGSHILPAFRKLINLFWLFDQSGAFDVLQNIEGTGFGSNSTSHQNSLSTLQQRLQDVPIDWESSSDVQRADICVTRQWMRAVLWRISVLRNSESDQGTSLSHPIQIAKEFLAVISKLPSTALEAHGPSIEFKIFEIASAVTDAMASNPRAGTVSENPREILRQLHRILASSRGGNVTLATMLRVKISQINDQQPVTLLIEPSPWAENDPEQWNTRVDVSPGFAFELNKASPGLQNPPSEEEENQQTQSTEGQEVSWSSTIGEELSATLANSSDLYEQLQNFDGSFNDFEAFGSLDRFLVENTPGEA